MDWTPAHGNNENTVSGNRDEEEAQAENSNNTSGVRHTAKLPFVRHVFSNQAAVHGCHKVCKGGHHHKKDSNIVVVCLAQSKLVLLAVSAAAGEKVMDPSMSVTWQRGSRYSKETSCCSQKEGGVYRNQLGACTAANVMAAQ